MTDWCTEIKESLRDFRTEAALAGDPNANAEVDVEFLAAPHDPPSRLPEGTMAVVGFWHDGQWLLIGKTGPNSGPRYTYQHYYARSAPSTLAKFLMTDPEMESLVGWDPESVRDWITASTNRVNILLPATADPDLLTRLKAFLHLRLHPRYGL